jgi:hypothetical protein
VWGGIVVLIRKPVRRMSTANSKKGNVPQALRRAFVKRSRKTAQRIIGLFAVATTKRTATLVQPKQQAFP